MAADHFHHQVEESFKRAKKVYDFENFKDDVKKPNSENAMVVEMTSEDFFQWPNYYSYAKVKKINPRPYLVNMVYV